MSDPSDDLLPLIRNALTGMVAGNVTQIGTLTTGSTSTVSWPTPQQLPGDVDRFVDRTDQLASLDTLLSADRVSSPIRVAAIVGTAGVGKTALALHWAHGVTAVFPDGSLYVNLRGFDPSNAPLEPAEALNQFIRAVGLPGQQPMPPSLEERTALFRTLTIGRHLLIVLDNAVNAEQVRPLVPSSHGCVILVTSRNSLTGLVIREGAMRITVPVLSSRDSVLLLAKLLQPDRLATSIAEDLPRLADRCARLPLALRVAAEMVTRSEFVSLPEMLEQLERNTAVLDTLSTGDDEAVAVKSVFSWSYRALSTSLALTFRLIGLHPGTSITAEAVGALLGTTPPAATQRLRELAEAHLIKETSRGRFRMHDLLRAYAIDRAATDDPVNSQREAHERLLAWYLHTADNANRILAPHRRHVALPTLPANTAPLAFDRYETAMSWCEAERLNLLSAIKLAEDADFLEVAWKLPSVLFSFYYIRNYADDWIASYTIGSRVAARLSDPHAESTMLHRLGVAFKETGQFNTARSHFETALGLRRNIGDRAGEATALSNIGLCLTGLGDSSGAIDIFHKSLSISVEVTDLWTQAWTLQNLGAAQRAAGRLRAALASEQRALELADDLDDRIVEGLALHQLGMIQYERADFAEAIVASERALQIARDLGHRVTEAGVLLTMGNALRAQQRFKTALTTYMQALVLYEAMGDRPNTAALLFSIAHVLAAGRLGDLSQVDSLQRRGRQILSSLREADT